MIEVTDLEETISHSRYRLWKSATDVRVNIDDLREVVELEILSPPRLRLLRQDKFEDARVLQGFRDGLPVLSANYDDVRQKVIKDSTLIIDNISPLFPTAERLCSYMEDRLSRPCPANLYCAATPAAGFGAHADQHDVLVVQLFGEKVWTFPNEDTDEEAQSMTIEAGDCLFVKEGVVHDVHAVKGMSVHLTIAIS